MASIKMKDDHEFDGKKLFKHVADYLPSYARPRFLRLQVQPLAIEFSYPLSETLVITEQFPLHHGNHNGHFHYFFQGAQ